MSAGDAPRHHLHPLELIAVSWRTARMEPARVIVPGLGIFGLDAIQGTFYTEVAVDHLGIGSLVGAVLFGASALGQVAELAMLEDADAGSEGMVRVIDESGEDYLYPRAYFADVALPQLVERALQAA